MNMVCCTTILVLLSLSPSSPAEFTWRKLQTRGQSGQPPSLPLHTHSNSNRRIYIQPDAVATTFQPTQYDPSEKTTVEIQTQSITPHPPTLTTTPALLTISPPHQHRQHPMAWQRTWPAASNSQKQFASLFGRVTPVRIEQTLHELTTRKGMDDVGEVSQFSLFHGNNKHNDVNLSKVSSSFMQKVTMNYLKNLRTTSEPRKIKRKVETTTIETNNNIGLEPLVLESREIDTDVGSDNLNMIDHNMKPQGDHMKRDPDYSLQPQNQNMELDNELQPLSEHININQAEDIVDSDISDKNLTIMNDDTLENELDTPTGYGDTFEFFDVPIQQNSSGENLYGESKSLTSDLIKSTYELEQEINHIQSDEDVDDSYYSIGREPSLTDIATLEAIEVKLNDPYKGQDLPQPTSSTNTVESETPEEKNDSYGADFSPVLQDNDKVVEEVQTEIPIHQKLKTKKPIYKELKRKSQTFGSPSHVFDAFGSDTFSNARFRIPEEFRKFLQQPPPWIKSPRW